MTTFAVVAISVGGVASILGTDETGVDSGLLG